ncbi:hypothetical protein E8D34_18585 [Nocardioides sp. GY 10113]|uniref:hypothetical protein n=1 Tax=Nocardioides sp. GY 10113 TaxID=2569761 RepID=UPI0010A82444|nr:hypothetical protein [Nocardioides sp. GY 10113]TIC80657.1 hypothetical protein E8D34_18585 [Nocardioides sp. GY 10113]
MTRLLLGAAGVLLAAYGAVLLLTRSEVDQLVSLVAWLAGGVLVHDAILAPLAIAVAWVAARLLPTWARGPAAVAGLLIGTLTLLAVPVLGGWGRRADNPSLLDRDYWAGWLLVVAVVVVGAVVAALVVRSRQRSGGADGQRARRG